MALIVQKFGGTSVADTEKIFNAARIITDTYKQGNDVVAVLSAQGDMTDELIAKANEINPNASKREMDMLMSTGEQISVALCAMAIESLGYPVVSLAGWQAGMETNSAYGNARIKKIASSRIREELDKRSIVIVAGFQGVNKYNDVTTLGRGGSDTTAVAIASALGAQLCQIYTDVDGVFTADPNKVPGARKLDEITYDEMLELAAMGAQVLHSRAVEMGKKHCVNLEVLSSFSGRPGTKIKEVAGVEKGSVSSVTKDDNISVITISGLDDKPGAAFRIFSLLSRSRVGVDIILQSAPEAGKNAISFTVARGDREQAVKVLQEYVNDGDMRVAVDDDVSKVSIVGSGMAADPAPAANMFEALFDAGINIRVIASGETRISVVIRRDESDKAVRVIHERFFGN